VSVLLAFDTSGPFGSVALGGSGVLVASALLPERLEHASRLLPTIDRVLAEGGMTPSDVSGIVVGEGPGSFTGVRVAAATAKGLAMALGVPLVPVSSLAAAAVASVVADGQEGGIRYVLFDARGDRVYGGCYRVAEDTLEELVPPHPGRLRDVLGGRVPPGAVFTGDGAARHRSMLQHAGFEIASDADTLALAVGLLGCTDRGAGPGTTDPSGWEPRYLRGSSAERLWSA
jgi:tRNA threonylcarbamoyladenosine biosynthesis protein TsaB